MAGRSGRQARSLDLAGARTPTRPSVNPHHIVVPPLPLGSVDRGASRTQMPGRHLWSASLRPSERGERSTLSVIPAK